jgi:hypothetical protein
VRAAGRRWPLKVTSPARTLADCLRHLPVEDSVAIGDAVLRSGEVDWDEVRRVLDRQEPWPYVARGREALHLLDPGRESYLESFSFVRLWQRGLEMPEPQVTIRDADGTFVARVDGWIAQGAVALEADGAGKYLLSDADDVDARTLTPHEIASRVRRAMAAQADRERRLVDLGVTVVRWGTAESLRRPEQLVARIRHVRQRAVRPFTGSATPQQRPPWLSTAGPRRPHLSATQAGFAREKPA